MKKILILGKSSYIGESFYKWLNQYPDRYNVEIVSTMNYEWKQADFSSKDVVVNFAGIAHINNITEDMRSLFYSVNRDLTAEIGQYAKTYGVTHFIQFSSMNVYGDYCECVTDLDAEAPTSFYGDSKLQGDIELRKLEDETFKIAYLRPPFVYGKGCKGNYNSISKIAKKIPVFPNYKNRKSMIYIDNLCEFVRLVIDSEVSGILAPQNKELVSTADLVRTITKVNGRKIIYTKLFNWCIPSGIKLTRFVKKAFVDDCYDLTVSGLFDFQYCVVDFEESVKRSEGI